VAQSEQFSIVVITDTQTYVEINPAVFEAQIAWVVDNQASENIIYAAHLGDLKDDLSCDNKTVGGRTEWEIVDDTLLMLEGANIPYGVVPGNHDFDQLGGGCPNWSTQRPLTLYNSVLGLTRLIPSPTMAIYWLERLATESLVAMKTTSHYSVFVASSLLLSTWRINKLLTLLVMMQK